MTVVTIWEFDVKKEALVEMREYLAEELVNTRKFKGCQGVTSLSGHDDPNILMFVVSWADKTAYEEYTEWRKGRGDRQKMNSLVNSGSARLFDPAAI